VVDRVVAWFPDHATIHRPMSRSGDRDTTVDKHKETMNMATVEQRVKAVTARVLNVDESEVKPESAFTTDLGAESVQSVELVASFEEEFGIEMDEDAALSVTNVGDAVEFIAKTCKEQGVEIEE
jgi:acyl carrier protein